MNMKIKIILFLIILLQFNSLNAERFQSLNSNMNIYDDDVDAMQNLLFRCSGLYVHLGFLIKDQEPKIALSFALISEAVTSSLYLMDMILNEYSTEEANASVNKLIEEMIEMYNEDMESNYVNTGSHYSKIARDDLATCTKYFAREFNIKKEGMYDDPNFYKNYGK